MTERVREYRQSTKKWVASQACSLKIKGLKYCRFLMTVFYERRMFLQGESSLGETEGSVRSGKGDEADNNQDRHHTAETTA